MKNFFYTSIGFLTAFFYNSAFAEDKPTIVVLPPADENYFPEIARNSGDSSGDAIARLITFGIGITAILAVIAVTWAGIMMLLSVGDQEKFNKAKDLLIYALVGVGFASGAYLIVTIISRLSFS